MQRAIIFANGELNAHELQHCAGRLQPDDLLIAADAGLRHCLALKLCPDLLVGDLDSVALHCLPAQLQELQAQGMEIQKHPAEKDETDLALALWEALKRGATHIAIIAAMGGRMDMTLSHFLLLAHPRLQHCTVQLWQGACCAYVLQAWVNCGRIHGTKGDTVSLLALSSSVTEVHTSGLRYALSGGALHLGSTRGLSNPLTTAEASVRIGSGVLMVVHIGQL